MPIQRLSLGEFGAFKQAEFRFSSGINVFIGANSTGKSHLLKLLYTSHRVAEEAASGPRQFSNERFGVRLAEKLAGVYRPE